mmetsp:Transcript_28131/g.85053  ORF Transcript_28131/g.85053 Transcript_28131/m.85053 type:complete len:200 (+) Transcript_28131:158-757(+)
MRMPGDITNPRGARWRCKASPNSCHAPHPLDSCGRPTVSAPRGSDEGAVPSQHGGPRPSHSRRAHLRQITPHKLRLVLEAHATPPVRARHLRLPLVGAREEGLLGEVAVLCEPVHLVARRLVLLALEVAPVVPRLLHRRHLLLAVERGEQPLQPRRLGSRQLRRGQGRLELEAFRHRRGCPALLRHLPLQRRRRVDRLL